MRTADHLLLGQYRLAHYAAPALQRHRRAFLLGCVEPDGNVFSYLRGMRHGEKLRGHNAESASAFLSRCMADFEKSGISSAWDCFRFGTLLHYAADAFTAPHNRFWQGSLREHRAYEAALHQRFAAMLETAQPAHLPRRAVAARHGEDGAEAGRSALGHEVRILTLSGSIRSYREGNVTFIGSVSVGMVYPNARLRTARGEALVQELADWKPDIVHSQCEFSTFSFAKRITAACGCPLVHTYHTVYEDFTHYFSPNVRFGRFLAAKFSRHVLPQTDAVIVPTEKIRTMLRGYGVT